MRTLFTGVGTALVTPFKQNGDLDEAAVRRLGRRQIDGGVHFLVPCGTTGENPTLTLAERIRVVEILVDEVEHFVGLKFVITPLSEVIDLVLEQALKEVQCIDDARQMMSPQFAGFGLRFFLE